MQYTLKEYVNRKDGISGKYLEYYDEKSGKKFTNAEYFIFDTICDDFKAIMSSTGGFTANMTTRMIKKLNIPCESIMLCQTPHSNNTFHFQFVYLDKDRNVLNVEWDNNPFDYEYFKKKFSSCIIEEGCVFDLLKYDYLEEVTKEFKTPTVNFDIQIDGREITPEDVLICKDLCFLKEEYVEKFKNLGVTHAELKLEFNPLNPSNFYVLFVKEDGNYLQNYSALENCKTWEEYKEKNPNDYDDDYYKNLYDTSVSVSIIRHLADHFSLKEERKMEEICSEEQEEKEM